MQHRSARLQRHGAGTGCLGSYRNGPDRARIDHRRVRIYRRRIQARQREIYEGCVRIGRRVRAGAVFRRNTHSGQIGGIVPTIRFPAWIPIVHECLGWGHPKAPKSRHRKRQKVTKVYTVDQDAGLKTIDKKDSRKGSRTRRQNSAIGAEILPFQPTLRSPCLTALEERIQIILTLLLPRRAHLRRSEFLANSGRNSGPNLSLPNLHFSRDVILRGCNRCVAFVARDRPGFRPDSSVGRTAVHSSRHRDQCRHARSHQPRSRLLP